MLGNKTLVKTLVYMGGKRVAKLVLRMEGKAQEKEARKGWKRRWERR